MCFFTMVGLLPQWMWNMAFILSSLIPSFRKSRRWAEQLLDHTVEAVKGDMENPQETNPGQKTHRYQSISQRLACQLHQDEAVGEAYGFS